MLTSREADPRRPVEQLGTFLRLPRLDPLLGTHARTSEGER